MELHAELFSVGFPRGLQNGKRGPGHIFNGFWGPAGSFWATIFQFFEVFCLGLFFRAKNEMCTYLDDPAECAGPLGGRGVRNQQELRCGSSTPHAPLKRGRADCKRFAQSAGPWFGHRFAQSAGPRPPLRSVRCVMEICCVSQPLCHPFALLCEFRTLFVTFFVLWGHFWRTRGTLFST